MSATSEVETLKAAKHHRCTWCWEHINPGEQYLRYRWWNCGDTGTEKMHPECHVAMQDAAEEEGGWFEWTPGMERPAHNASCTPSGVQTGEIK